MKMQQTFKQFLSEQYKTRISGEKVIEIFKNECKDFLAGTPTHPLVRGMTGSDEESLIIHGEKGGRKSANTTNHYTAILDHTLGKIGYPLRSKSIICGNWENRGYAESFGNAFAIIPFDGVKIGVCPKYDLWATILAPGVNQRPGQQLKMDSLNNAFERAGAPSDSFTDLVNYIEGLFDSENFDPDKDYLLKHFDKGRVKEQLESSYSEKAGFELETSRTINALPGEREVWVGGKCLAIPLDHYEHVLSRVRDKE